MEQGNDTVVVQQVQMPPYWDIPTRITLAVIMVFIILLGLVGNSMVIIVVGRHHGMRTRTNMFLCNLAVADLLCTVICMPFSLGTVIIGDWVFGDIFCQINAFLMPVFFIASIHTLMYISIHKYISIIHPFSHVLGKGRIVLMIVAAWSWGILTAYMAVHGLNHAEYKPYTTQCGPSYPKTLRNYMHPLYTISTCYLIPFMIMTFCYLRMFREIKAHSKRLELTTNQQPYTIFLQQRRITLTLFLVLLAFVFCWTPYVLYSAYASAIKDKTSLPHVLNAVSYWCGYLNSAVNPIIYALRSPAFREGYKEIMCQGKALITSEGNAPATGIFSIFFQTEPQDTTTLEKFRWFIKNSLFSQNNSTQGTAAKRKISAYSFRPTHKPRTPSTGSLPRNFKYGVNGRPGSVEVIRIKGAPAITVNGKAIYTKPRVQKTSVNSVESIDPSTQSSVEKDVDNTFKNLQGQTTVDVDDVGVNGENSDTLCLIEEQSEDGCDTVFTVEADIEQVPSAIYQVPDIIVTSMEYDCDKVDNQLLEDKETKYGRSVSDNTNRKAPAIQWLETENATQSKSETYLDKAGLEPSFFKRIFKNRSRTSGTRKADDKSEEKKNNGGFSRLFLPQPKPDSFLRSQSAEESRQNRQTIFEDQEKAVSDSKIKQNVEVGKSPIKRYSYNRVSWNELSDFQKGDKVEVVVRNKLKRSQSDKPRMLKGMSIEHLDKIRVQRANSVYLEKQKRKSIKLRKYHSYHEKGTRCFIKEQFSSETNVCLKRSVSDPCLSNSHSTGKLEAQAVANRRWTASKKRYRTSKGKGQVFILGTQSPSRGTHNFEQTDSRVEPKRYCDEKQTEAAESEAASCSPDASTEKRTSVTMIEFPNCTNPYINQSHSFAEQLQSHRSILSNSRVSASNSFPNLRLERVSEKISATPVRSFTSCRSIDSVIGDVRYKRNGLKYYDEGSKSKCVGNYSMGSDPFYREPYRNSTIEPTVDENGLKETFI